VKAAWYERQGPAREVLQGGRRAPEAGWVDLDLCHGRCDAEESLVFANIRVFFLGSDDFPSDAKIQATRDLNAALDAGWPGFEIGERVSLAEIARAHELVDHPARRGRVVLLV
jgi:hypothetical protein